MIIRPKLPTFYHFSELELNNIQRDFQVHTNWTDGEGSINDVLLSADKAGISEIAFTEHARSSSTYYPDFFLEVDRYLLEFESLKVYRGFEIKILNNEGLLDMTKDMYSSADLILGSVHSFPLPSGDVANVRNFSEKDAWDIEFNLAKSIVTKSKADVLSHAGGMCIRAFNSFPMEYFDELIYLCSQNNCPFEINASYHFGIIDNLIELLEKYNPLVSIGSDAHKINEIGLCRDLLLDRLKL